MPDDIEVRLDKWLWATRVFKTRTQAIDACRAGHIKIASRHAKPSRPVRLGEVITARIGDLTRTVRVAGLLQRRVGAKVVDQYLEDLTPASEYQKPREQKFSPLFYRPKGLGRPTKKQRRDIDQLGP